MTSHKRIVYPPIWLIIGLVTIFALDHYLPLARFDSSFATSLGSFTLLC